MNRRSFLTSSVAATAVAGVAQLSTARAADSGSGGKQKLLDWRQYQCPTAEKRDLVLRFFKDAAIPGLNRIGVRPVGVFLEKPETKDFSVYTLAAYPDMDTYVNVGERLGNDAAFVEGATEYLGTKKDDPAYDRISTKLMWSFTDYPDVKVPRQGERIFEVRIYENHNEWKAKLKIEMFNEAELDIFKQVKLDGVFYGEALSGPDLPNLTYMLAYKDEAEQKKSWDAFRSNSDWEVLKNNQRYADTVSKIHSKMLVPADCSQI
jgi:hypothetical protein